MSTTIAKYREGRTREVTLPSGAIFVIRKMPIMVFSEVMDTLGINVPPGVPIEQVEATMRNKVADGSYNIKMIESMLRIIPRCVVELKITPDPTPESLGIDEIEPGDLFALFELIMDFSGISKLAEDKRESFRQ